MNLLEAIQLRAMANVALDEKQRKEQRPEEFRAYFIRFVCRWYSKTFSTPLHVTFELPLEDVLTAYYEERYENMQDEELEQIRFYLCETEQERAKREADEAAYNAEEAVRVREIEEEEQARLERIEKKRKKKLVDGDEDVKGQLVLETMGGGKARVVPESELRESDLPMTSSDEPLIKMSFVDDATFDREIEGFGAMSQPSKT